MKLQTIDFPEFTETELKELCSVPCRVELFHSNVCHGVEKSWPKRMYNRQEFKDLNPWQKRRLYQKMIRNAVYLYNRYVDENRLKERRKNRTNRALAPYYEERYLRNCFNRIKALGDSECDRINLSDSDASLITVINTSDYENLEFSLRSRRIRPKKSRPGPKSSKARAKNTKSKSKNSKSSSLISTSNSKRSKPQSSIHSDSGPEIENESRIIYEHSSSSGDENYDDDEYFSANELQASPGRRSKRSAPTSAARASVIKSEKSSPFVTPSKEMDDFAPISTPAIEQLRRLRSIIHTNNVSNDRNVGMVIEVESESIVEYVQPTSIRARKTTNRSVSNATRKSIENIDSSSDDSLSIDSLDIPLVIDERFNDLISESSVTSSMQINNDDVASLRSLSTPRIDSSELRIINSNELQRLRNMNITENLNISFSSSRSGYSLRNQKASPSNSGYSLRQRKSTINP